jgi:MFS transporter, NNP family, nitrate/nitrite transporter
MTALVRSIRSGHPGSLFSAFLYFDVSFMVWVLVGALGIFIAQDLALTATQKGLVVAVPLLGGAAMRVLLGLLADRFGPKFIGSVSLTLVLIPLAWGWLAAENLAELVGVGLLLGIAGASFAVALPLASRWYPPEHQGIAMGIAGAGNSGTIIAVLVAPRLAQMGGVGWHGVFGLAMIPVTVTLVLFLMLAREAPNLSPQPAMRALRVLGEPDLWWFMLFYGVTFGGFVGLASFLAIFFHDHYGVAPVTAGTLTALCVFAGSFFRPVGGWWADRLGGLRVLRGIYLVCAAVFAGVALLPALAAAVGLIACGMLALGMGNGAIFQMVPQRFKKEIGMVSGLVGAAGGVGGFFLPLVLGALKDMTGSYGGGFLVCSLAACGGLIPITLHRQQWQRVWLPERLALAPAEPVAGAAQPAIARAGRVRMEIVFGG